MPVPLTDANRAQLVRARVSRGWSQQHLADLVGVAKQQVGRMESGVRQPSRQLLDSVADALGLTVDVESTVRVRFRAKRRGRAAGKR